MTSLIPSKPHPKAQGFTLVELLVALAIMAIMAGLSWRGLDVMIKSREITQKRVDEIASLENVMRQWDADLNALFPITTSGAAPSFVSQPNNSAASNSAASNSAASNSAIGNSAPSNAASTLSNNSTQILSIDWDGRVLKLMRRSGTPSLQGTDSGLNVVGWTMRDNTWVRWQSPDLVRSQDLIAAWNQVSLWGQNAGSESKQYETVLMSSGGWQIYYYRDNAWSNPLSSSGATPSSSAVGAGNIPDAVRIEVQLPPSLGGTILKDWVRPSFSISRS